MIDQLQARRSDRLSVVFFPLVMLTAVVIGLGSSQGVAHATSSLGNGQNVTGVIVNTTQIDTWTFDAHASDAISLTVSESGTNTAFVPQIRVQDPNGTQVFNTWGDLWAEADFTATLTGTYTVLINRVDATTAGGAYILTLAQSPGTFIVPLGDEGGPIVNGGNYTGNILRGDLDQWSFQANAGDAIALTVSELGANTAFVPRIRVHGPDGTQLGNTWGDLWAESDFAAPLTGSYTVLINRVDAVDGVGAYTLTLAQAPGTFIVPVMDEGGPIVNGVNYTGNILRGDLDQWSFQANAADSIVLTVSELGANTPFVPRIRVHGPDGRLLGDTWGDLWAESDFAAPLTGSYTVLINRVDAADGVGAYTLTMAQAPGTFIVPVNDEGGPIVNGGNYTGNILRGDLDQWSFQANAGDAIALTVSELGTNTAFVPRIRVHGPDGRLLGDTWGNLWVESDFAAPLTGSYTVLINRVDAADGIGAYILTLAQAPGTFIVPVNDEGGAMVNGGNYTGTILRGDLDQWSFQANAADSIVLTVSELGTNTAFVPRIRVHGPDGRLLGDTWGDLWGESDFTAPLTGTYTVLVNRIDAADGAGTYMLTLAQSPRAFIVPVGDEGGSIVNGGNYTGTILRGDLDQWSFQARAADGISVTVSEIGTNTAFVPRIRVFGPDGTLLGNTWGDLWAESDFTAPLTGTYTVLINRIDAADGAGAYGVTLAQSPGSFFVPAGDEGGTIVNGGIYAGSILRGDMDQWSFQARAGDGISLTVSESGTNTAFVPRIRVHGPDGRLLGDTWGDLWAESDFTAPLNGTYTVLINRIDAADGPGAYLLALARAPGQFIVPAGDSGGALVVGLNPTGTILRGDLDQWRFNALAGDHVSLTVNEVGANTAFVPRIRVHGPDGTQLGNTWADVTANVAFIAPLSGSYTVLINRIDAADGPGTYQLTSSHAGSLFGCIDQYVRLSAVPNGHGGLNVTVTSTDPTVLIQQLVFSPSRNGLIDIGPLVSKAGQFTYALPNPAVSINFTVRRLTPGVATTVPFMVNGGCGGWQTFVGGGAGAF